jgi:hypothetical protein
MIADSWSWKRYVAKCAASLERASTQRRWPDAAFARVERDILVAAFAVRKLMDSYKLSDEMERANVRCTVYPALAPLPDYTDRHEVDKYYDLSMPRQRSLSLRNLCNQIVHSYVLFLDVDAGSGLGGFFVVSERDREQCVRYMAIANMYRLLREVAEDDIVYIERRRPKPGEPLATVRKSRSTGPDRGGGGRHATPLSELMSEETRVGDAGRILEKTHDLK